ncbi:MAG: DUF3536 domain-containing protein [Pyrinomonadaceae bacterium]
MPTSLIIHGHFYQPPRENPWTDQIDLQAGAAPFTNWNERIFAECYRANAFARVSDGYGRVEQIINNYANINFNFGPTLLSWMERHHPRVYQRIIAADSESVRLNGGHGNAIAQGYHHAILPLCNERDRLTEIRWGLADFRFRYGREAESIWLPETACDAKTLSALIEAGLKYVILSPHQAERVRPLKGGTWRDVSNGSIDPSHPYSVVHPDATGRSIAVFFYDGALAREIAFEGALASSHGLVERFVGATRGDGDLVHTATDGESYGHHYKFGDRTLAYALQVEAASRGFRVTNYSKYLAENSPIWEVEIKAGPTGEGTAWSCSHGVGRWSRDCGCQSGAPEGWNQKWRTPLRLALEFLRDAAAAQFESVGAEILADPWGARDDYIQLMVDPAASREWFYERNGKPNLNEPGRVRGLALLEMQRSSLMMFTSCGWFFNDISGIETVQILLYAGRVLERLERLGMVSPRDEFLERLAEAKSNALTEGNGADIFRRNVAAAQVSPERVAANIALTGLAARGDKSSRVASYFYSESSGRVEQNGRITLSTVQISLADQYTGELSAFAVGALHFGDVDFYCAVHPSISLEDFKYRSDLVWNEFPTASLPRLLRLVQEQFGPDEFGLEHLLADGRARISRVVFDHLVERFSDSYEKLYEDNRRNIEILQQAGFDLPTELRAAVEFTVARRFETALREFQDTGDLAAWQRALTIGNQVVEKGYRVRRTVIVHMFEEMITRLARRAVSDPESASVNTAIELTHLANRLKLEVNVDRAQEAMYDAMTDQVPDTGPMRDLALMLNVSPTVVHAKPASQLLATEAR